MGGVGNIYRVWFGRTVRLWWISLFLVTVGATTAVAAPFAYVTSNEVSVVDTGTNTVVATVPVAGGGVAITPDGAFAYVTNFEEPFGSVWVIDTATNTVVATVPVSSPGGGVAITPF